MGAIWNVSTNSHIIQSKSELSPMPDIKKLNFNLADNVVRANAETGFETFCTGKKFAGRIHIFSVDKANKLVFYVLWIGEVGAEPKMRGDKEWWE